MYTLEIVWRDCTQIKLTSSYNNIISKWTPWLFDLKKNVRNTRNHSMEGTELSYMQSTQKRSLRTICLMYTRKGDDCVPLLCMLAFQEWNQSHCDLYIASPPLCMLHWDQWHSSLLGEHKSCVLQPQLLQKYLRFLALVWKASPNSRKGHQPCYIDLCPPILHTLLQDVLIHLLNQSLIASLALRNKAGIWLSECFHHDSAYIALHLIWWLAK